MLLNCFSFQFLITTKSKAKSAGSGYENPKIISRIVRLAGGPVKKRAILELNNFGASTPLAIKTVPPTNTTETALFIQLPFLLINSRHHYP
jgi:hypothetical protein